MKTKFHILTTVTTKRGTLINVLGVNKAVHFVPVIAGTNGILF